MKAFNRNIFRVLLTAGLLLAGTDVMWGEYDYYAKVTGTVSPTGTGTVYVSLTKGDYNVDNKTSETGESGSEVIFYIKAEPESNYHFVNWTNTSTNKVSFKETGGDKKTETSIGANRATTANDTKEYVIQANFGRDSITITFNANGGSGSMGDQIVQSGVETAINSLGFTNNYTVTFNANGGLVNGKSSDGITKSRFTRWKHWTSETDFVPYNDGESITLTLPHGSTYSLQATWADKVKFSFPSATRGDRQFEGWYTESTGGTKKGVANSEVDMQTANLYAHWGDPFYAKVSLSETEGASESATVDATEKNSDTKNTDLTFSIEAKTPASGYHFTGWSGTNVTFADNSQLKTTATVKSSSTAGVLAETVAEIKANYAPNVYWASLTATYGEHGTASVMATKKSTTTPGGDVVFEITAVPQTGYHLVEWTKDGSVGTFGSSTSATTTFTVPAATSYDVENATSYTVHATFAKDMFNAKLTASVSSLSPASSSTAKVSKDNTVWSESETVSAATSNQDVTFYVKATPAAGYEFLGWSLADNSTDYVAGLGAEGTYTIKSAVNQGDTNAKTLYAVFRAVYSIKINANCTPSSSDMIVFNVTHKTESVNYRVSVPVGGTITLKDVPAGAYTVTPESAWSWDYTVSAAQTTSFNTANLSEHNFTVTPKNSQKKHDESLKQVE